MQRRKVEKIWRKFKLTSDYSLFKAKRNYATFLINKARKAFYAYFIEKNSSDQGKLFRGMKKLLAPKETLHFPDYRDNCILANDTGKFFNHKISNIRKELDASINSSDTDTNTVPDNPILDCSQHLSEFRELSCEEVQSIIQKSAKKTYSLDPMPTSMVVACLEELLSALTRIVNLSLSLGHFPSKWKEALVDPRLKKSGKDISFQNLRPVSNLQFVSKLSERAVFNQIHEHMMKFELYPLLQSAYRFGHSTETVLLKVQNDILLNMDRQRR